MFFCEKIDDTKNNKIKPNLDRQQAIFDVQILKIPVHEVLRLKCRPLALPEVNADAYASAFFIV